MDILTYIDRVKANYSKQPEPVYNTQKYFTGGRVGFDKGGDVERLKELLNRPDRTQFIKEFKIYKNKSYGDNFLKAAESLGVKREKITSIFKKAGVSQGGLGTKLKTTTQAPDNAIRLTDFTTQLKKNQSKLKNLFDSNEYVTINDLANKLGIDISKKTNGKFKDRNDLTGTLKRMGVESRPLTANIREYKVSSAAKKFTEENIDKRVKGEPVSRSNRKKNLSLIDPELELDKEQKKVLDKVGKISQKEGLYLSNAVENIGHAASVNIANKYPKLIKDSNILDIQSLIYQDKTLNIDILSKGGFDNDFDSVFKKLNSLVDKPVTQETRKQLINLKNEMSSIRDRSIVAIKTEAKEFPYLKGQEKRIPKLDIKIPDVGQKFESKNLYADMSVVDQQYRVGKINTVNRSAKTIKDLNPEQLKKYKENMVAQNSDNVQKFYTAVKDKKTGQAVFSKVDIDDLGEAIEAIGCPNNKAMGGRAEFNTGTNCFLKGQKVINSGKIAKGAQGRNLSKLLNSVLTKSGTGLRAVMKFGIIPEALFLGAESLIRLGMGDTLDEAITRSTGYFRPGDQTREADTSMLTRLIGPENAKTALRVRDYEQSLNNLSSAKQKRDSNQSVLSEDPYSYTSNVDSTKQLEIDNERVKQAERDLIFKFRPEAERDQAARLELEAADRFGTKSVFKKFKENAKKQDVDDVEQISAPEITQKDLNKRMGDPVYSIDDIANSNITDEILNDIRKQYKNPNITKQQIFKEIRKNPDFNKNIFKGLFEEARKNSSNQEQLFGASGKPFGDYISNPQREGMDRMKKLMNIPGVKGVADMASGGLADLTRTIAPKKGPQSEGLAYFMKNGKK